MWRRSLHSFTRTRILQLSVRQWRFHYLYHLLDDTDLDTADSVAMSSEIGQKDQAQTRRDDQSNEPPQKKAKAFSSRRTYKGTRNNRGVAGDGSAVAESLVPASWTPFETLQANGTAPAHWRKRKVALVLVYRGTNLKGLQLQLENGKYSEDTRTVESELHHALYESGMLHPLNVFRPARVDWSRSGRTDKGVHAAGSVLAAKLALPPNGDTEGEPTLAELRDRINSHLPADKSVRVIDIVRLQKSFNARFKCTSRCYMYTLPSFALGVPITSLSVSSQFESAPQCSSQELEQFRAFRADAALLERLERHMRHFENTHSFHHLTVGCKAGEARARRHIKSATVAGTFVDERTGVEFVQLKFHGQSFMQYQVRRMVGFLVVLMRFGARALLDPRGEHSQLKIDADTDTDRDTEKDEDEVWRLLFATKKDERVDRFDIPRAPACGLFKERCFFDDYNRKIAEIDDRTALDMRRYDSEVKAYINEVIMPDVVQQALEGSNVRENFYTWIARLQVHRWGINAQADSSTSQADPASAQTESSASVSIE